MKNPSKLFALGVACLITWLVLMFTTSFSLNEWCREKVTEKLVKWQLVTTSEGSTELRQTHMFRWVMFNIGCALIIIDRVKSEKKE